MKKLEFSLYNCLFQIIFRAIFNKSIEFNLYDNFALCCILFVLSLICKKEINI